MWPMLLDMSRDECKRILRRLELEAYASIITAFRAQGSLTKEKKNILKDIASELNISMERHRAEVRRAVNDEKLATIAEHMAGPDTGTEWAIVGRRLVPLMPRLVPQTAFTVLANNVANLTAAGNARLPVPAATAKLPGSAPGPESSTWEPSVAEGSKVPHCPPAQPHQAQSGNLAEHAMAHNSSQPDNSSIVSEVHIKRELDDDREDDIREKCSNKRMRTSSLCESDPVSSSTMVTSLSQSRPVSTISSTLASSKMLATTIAASTTSQSATATSPSVTSNASRVVTVSAAPVPVKITLTSTSTWSTSTTSSSSSGATQKVIIVSSSGPCGSPSILQRSLSVPMVKTVSSTQSSSSTSSSSVTSSGSSSMSSALSRGPTSYIINSSGGQASSQSGTVVTISTGSSNENSGGASSRNNSDGNMTATTVSIDGVPTAAYISSGASGAVSGSAVSILGTGSSGCGGSTSSGNMVHKIRPKPQSVSIGGISRPRTGPIVIPVTPNTHHPLHQSLACGGASGITVQQQKPKSLLGVHTVKQEVSGCTVSALGKAPGGMKILPISGVASGSSSMAKILPKPAKGSSLYVVNANSSTTTTASQMSVVSRVVPTSVLSPSPNLNLPTSSVSVLGTRTISTGSGSRINLSATAVARSANSPSILPASTSGTSTQHTSNTTSGGTAVLMHQTGRTAPATASSSNATVTSISTISTNSVPSSSSTLSSLGCSSGKSNVIVVQKGPSGNTTFCRGVSLGTTTKEFVGKVLKGKTINSSSMTAITVQRRPTNANSSTVSASSNSASTKNGTGLNLPTSNSQGNVIVLDLSNEQIGSNSILNELLQGSGIYTEPLGISANGTNTNAITEESNNVVESSRLSPPTSDALEDLQINQVGESNTASMLNVSQTRVVTLEEAVELFGASVGEDGQILLGKKASIVEEPKQTAQVSSTSAKTTESGGHAVPSVEAEVTPKEMDIPEDSKVAEPNIFVSEIVKEDSSSTNQLENKSIDIFSTAIASAEINLNSIQYLDEDTEEEVGSFAVTIEPAPFDAAEIQIEEDTTS